MHTFSGTTLNEFTAGISRVEGVWAAVQRIDRALLSVKKSTQMEECLTASDSRKATSFSITTTGAMSHACKGHAHSQIGDQGWYEMMSSRSRAHGPSPNFLQ